MKRKIFLCAITAVFVLMSSYAYSAGASYNGIVEGYILDWSDGMIKIEEYDGTIRQFQLDAGAEYFIDGRYAKPSGFRKGTEVQLKLEDGSIVRVEGFSTANAGYIQPGGKVRGGIVREIDRDQIILKLATGEIETYFTSPSTVALKEGINVPLGTLCEGDRVRLFFDEADTPFISRIQIEGSSVVIKKIMKGEINAVDSFSNRITLDNVKALKNGEWVSEKSSADLQYPNDVPIYVAGKRISGKDLKYYQGKTVYIAASDFFGRPKIQKMSIKTQYETRYSSEKVEEVNWFTGILELSNNRNIAFNEGSIILKNGRLVDEYAINPMSNVFIIAGNSGTGAVADIVDILDEDLNNSNIGQISIYAGRLDEITRGSVFLRKFFLLNLNSWESFNTTKEMYYSQDTYVYDAEAGEAITAEELLSGDYAVDEDSDYAEENDLRDWYAYIYANGDMIEGMLIKKEMDSLLAQRVTQGYIEEIWEDELVGWTVELANCSDWSERKEKWMQKSSTTNIGIQNAMIVKYHRFIPPEELDVGDRLYIIRDGFEAKVVIVK